MRYLFISYYMLNHNETSKILLRLTLDHYVCDSEPKYIMQGNLNRKKLSKNGMRQIEQTRITRSETLTTVEKQNEIHN